MDMHIDVTENKTARMLQLETYWSFADVSREVMEGVMSEFAGLLPRGFQAYTEIDLSSDSGDGAPEIDLCQIHYWDGNAGSFAHAKLNTLIDFPDRLITGGVTPQELIDMIRKAPNPDTADARVFMEKIGKMNSIDQMMRADHETLRDEWDLSVFYGGVKFPFLLYGSQPSEKKLNFKLSISGAEDDKQDLRIAFHLFKEFQPKLVDLYRDFKLKFDCSALKEIEICNNFLKECNFI